MINEIINKIETTDIDTLFCIGIVVGLAVGTTNSLLYYVS